MENFWASDVWGFINIVSVLLISLLVANTIKRKVKFLKHSLVPTSVIGGLILLIISFTYQLIAGKNMFEGSFFGGNGLTTLEVITYHALALGFIATTLKETKKKFDKKRTGEIFNTGVTTVSTYLLQGIVGLGITILIGLAVPTMFKAAGILLPFGYGQGTGQALNYGSIYEQENGFVGGRSFGLSVAALGFLSAGIGGVIHLAILKRKNIKFTHADNEAEMTLGEVQAKNEIPMNGSMDKLTVQIAFVFLTYILTYLLMWGLGALLPGMKAVIYGFNFLIGVLLATAVKGVLKLLRKSTVMHRQYTNNFLLTRVGNFFFDIMVVAGVAAIRLEMLKQYWWVLLILGVIGALITYYYNLFIAKKLFPGYAQEQFLAMYGMLTGTASTGIILLREIDGNFESPVADNLIYQNFPAIIFGFPMMLIAPMAPTQPYLTLGIVAAFFVVMNIILFRNQIFRRKPKNTTGGNGGNGGDNQEATVVEDNTESDGSSSVAE